MGITTIQIDTELKEKLDMLKIHDRESYNELISRLSNLLTPKNKKMDSLIETIETMSDPDEMREIALALRNVERGELVDYEELKKELKINV